MVDDLEEWSLDGEGTQSAGFSKDWGPAGTTVVGCPEVMLPNGLLTLRDLDHEEIDELIVADAFPTAVTEFEVVAGRDSVGFATSVDKRTRPAVGSKFRVGLDTSVEQHENGSTIPAQLYDDLPMGTQATVALEITRADEKFSAKPSRYGIAPFVGNTVRGQLSDDGQSAYVSPRFNPGPAPVSPQRGYSVQLEDSAEPEYVYIEITDTESQLRGKTVETL